MDVKKNLDKLRTICFITTGDLKTNATSKRALGMADMLSDLGWKVYVIMEDTEENHHRALMECDARTTFLFFQQSSAFGEIKAKTKFLKKIRPDYVYLCAFVFRNMVFCGHKCIKIVEHSELMSAVCHRNRLRKVLDALLEYGSLMYADGFVNASKFLQEVYQARCGKFPWKVRMPMLYLPYAYNPQMMHIDISDHDIQKRYNAKTIFVYLGTISRNYGIYTIIEAARMLKVERDDFCVVVLGHGKDYNAAVRLIKEYELCDCVGMCGFVKEEDIPSYFSIASAFISPMNDTTQDWARCPSKLYMYLPYNKPVITCRIGEPLSVFGENGLYYLPGNASTLKERMTDVMERKVTTSQVNPLEHTWKSRVEVFDKWIDRMFMTKQLI